MQTATVTNDFDILKMYGDKIVICIDKTLREKVYSAYKEDAIEDEEMQVNRDHLIQKYEESLQS